MNGLDGEAIFNDRNNVNAPYLSLSG